MKKHRFLLQIFFFLMVRSAVAQQGIDFTVGAGAYFTPISGTATRSGYFQGEMEYHHTSRLSFSAGIITSNYTFPGDEGIVIQPNGTILWTGIDRLLGTELQSNFLAKYAVYQRPNFAIRVGTGIGLISYSRQVMISTSTSRFPVDVANTDLGFPIQVEAEQKVYRNIHLGLRAGTFVFPDYPLVGHHTGLVVKYRLK